MTDDRRLARNPIAIVGMSGLLPHARNHREYWQNIIDGVDCTTEVPASRWSLDDYYDPDAATPDKTYSRRGAFLPDIAFDPMEFGLPPNQLEVTSTMQTLSLGVARDLLVDAGATGSSWYDASRTGVVLGTTGPVPLMHPLAARLSTPVLKEAARSIGLTERDADAIATKYVAAFAPWEANSFPGLLSNITAGRIANRLGLGGINCTVDAACAASLAALRTAIAELQDGRADMMITGGVDTENTIFIYLCFSKVGALSASGRIKPFGADADGTLLGEGITMLALRRLADACRDGNRIYAVIRGLGSSSDGRAKSIYAPRAGGQRVALDRAYADAEISPADIALLEAHATGTPVGDRTELTALKELLSDATDERRFAALGSVKSQIGHTKGAAGTASLMKLAFALHQKVLPGTINVSAPNAEVAPPEAPFYVNTRTRPWIRDPQRPVRRAAASAFGFGGTNFHVVLEEADADRAQQRVLHRTARAHLWHAPDVAGLIDAVRSVAPVDGGPIPDAHARIGFVSVDDENAEHLRTLAVDELVRRPDAEAWDHPEGVYFRAAALPDRKAGALFAGQGSQYVEMGAAAAMAQPQVGAAFDAANQVFAGEPVRLSAVVFPPPAFDEDTVARQEATLRRTEFAQPAIGALAAGQFAALRERGFRAEGYLGHSFGELTALWAAGALTGPDFFTLAKARGAAMAPREGVEAGTMVALNASIEVAREIVDGIDDVWICNHNAPDQVVIGGGADGVAAAVAGCAERGVATRALPVSGAFHTPYVAHAVDAFAAALGEVTVGAPHAPVYANSADAAYGADSAANRAVLTGQLGRPVEFVAALTAMREAGCTVFVEFGPKQVLTSLVRRTLGDDVIAIPTDSGPIGDSDLTLTRAAVRLAVLGFELTAINRHVAPDPTEPVPSGRMTVTISAPEYVPESRRAAYAAALGDGYRVAVAAPAEPSAAADVALAAPLADRGAESAPESHFYYETPSAPSASTHTSEIPVPSTPHPLSGSGEPLDSALAQHLRTHHQFLDGQLDMARALVGALDSGVLTETTVRAIEAVKEHGVAISASHTRASDVLAQLAELEAGFARPAALRPAPAERRAAMREHRPEALSAAAGPESANGHADGASANGDRGIARRPARQDRVDRVVAADHDMQRVSAQGVVAVDDPATTSAPAAAPDTDTPVDGAAPAGRSAEALRQALREVVAEKTGYPVEMVDTGMDLEADLGVDSIKRVQVIGALQERFPDLPNLGPEQLGTLRTLDQIADLLGVPGSVAHAPAGSAPVADTGSAAAAAPGSVAAAASGSTATAAQAPGIASPADSNSADRSVEALRQALREVVAEKTGYPVEMVDTGMDLEADLGVDSIKRVQVIGALQERFPDLPNLGPEQLGTLRTLDQIVAELGAVAGGDVHPKAEAAAGAPRHAVELVTLPAVDTALRAYRAHPRAVLVDLPGSYDPECDALAAALTDHGWQVRRVTGLPEPGDPVDLCLVLLGGAADWSTASRLLAETILTAGRVTPVMTTETGRAAFVTLIRLDGGLGLRAVTDPVAALLGGVGGVVKTLAAERPDLFCRALDIDPAADPGRCADLVAAELLDPARDTAEVGVAADGTRHTLVPGGHGPGRTVTAVRPAENQPPATLTADDLLVVTGGARGVTATCVRALARRGPGRFLLLGRTALAPEPDWARDVADADLRQAAVRALAGGGATPRDLERACADVRAGREIRATLADLGDRAEYLAVDTTDADAVRTALAPWRDAVTGLVHGAGVLADSHIPAKTPESIARVLDPKIAGLAALLAAVPPPRHLILFTSVAGLFGNTGQADYAAANEALSRFAAAWRRAHPHCHVTAIDWGAWDGGMVTPGLREHFRARGVSLLAPADGAAAFTEQFTAERAADTVVLIGPAAGLAEPAPVPAAPVRLRRALHGLTDEPVVRAHRVGEHLVLPATFGLGAMAHTAERALPGRIVVAARDFQVLKGLVFDHPVEAVDLELEPGALDGDILPVRVTVRDGAVTHFRATLELASAPGEPPRITVPDGPGSDLDIYREAIQFHAPALQGLRRLVADTGAALVFDCLLDAEPVAGGAYASRLHDPVRADLMMQGPPVLGHRVLGAACLPLGIGRVEYYRPLPVHEPFSLVVDNARQGRFDARVDATACTADGTVLQRFSDVVVVTTPDLTEKFRSSVRRWTV
ncbi:type I polyketide synthase [Nocardia farcinica]|uniref:type I polyketide synthase n=3 Tax=Nocardia TaxID=1817 RepID=UPI0018949ABF|nr:type I polyketide synthase [Nocardia farcinica]MBF6183926.1 KR domain-containing protein [Nocardia farcinica]MBF6292869.1 KR domain-containing protein [Nocardia farcinica]MBF6309769.1 KR domain-containing protein [Nocardia farcinica]MBF6379164.1 KR domain-containing protein [Nocardia farcinica]MBF6383878.1 KR domain-containing protein [Nocardia farcinica]